MSLPIGHALAGVCVYAAFAPKLKAVPRPLAWAMALVIPQVPDFDFFMVWVLGLPSQIWHRTWSHSLLFATLCGLLAAWAWGRWRSDAHPSVSRWVGFFVATLLLSHCVLDLFGHGAGGTQGRGVMLWWPFGEPLILPRAWQPLPPGRWGGGVGAIRAVLGEVLWLALPAGVAYYTRLRRRASQAR